MFRLSLILLISFLFISCGPRKLTTDEITKEKQSLEKIINTFWKTYESKDVAALDKMISTSPEFIFFGTDSAEVSKNLTLWDKHKKDDFELFESLKTGALRNFVIQIDSYGTLASTVYEIPLDMVIGGKDEYGLFRCAMSFVKEKGEWHLIHGMSAFATVGRSSAELVKAMEEEKAKEKKK
jgi:hypothetical protein